MTSVNRRNEKQIAALLPVEKTNMHTTNKRFTVDSNATLRQFFDRFIGLWADYGIIEVITSTTVLDTTKVYNFIASSLKGVFPLMEVEKEISYKGRIHHEFLGGDVR